MSDDKPSAAGLRQDLAALRYLDAVEAGDWEAAAALWEQAAGDPDLAEALEELSDGLAAELEPGPGWHADAAAVVALIDRHLPSAAPPPQPPPGPPTAGDVAARIAGDVSLLSKLGPDERQVNAALLADRTPLPAEMGVGQLAQWASSLPVGASQAYWRVFRHVAVLLTMTRPPQAGGGGAGATLAAARAPSANAKPPQSHGEAGGPRP